MATASILFSPCHIVSYFNATSVISIICVLYDMIINLMMFLTDLDVFKPMFSMIISFNLSIYVYISVDIDIYSSRLPNCCSLRFVLVSRVRYNETFSSDVQIWERLRNRFSVALLLIWKRLSSLLLLLVFSFSILDSGSFRGVFNTVLWVHPPEIKTL